MKKNIIFLFLLSAHSIFSQPSILPDAGRVLSDIETLSAFYPSEEGSPNEEKVSQFIITRLLQTGTPFSRKNFSSSEQYHSFSHFIEARIAGTRTDTVFVVIPMNNVSINEKESDTLVNVAIGLELIARVAREKPEISIHFLFIGGEFGDSPDYPLGSRIFLDDFYPNYPSIFLYLNFRNIPKRVLVQGAVNGVVAPNWLIVDTSKALQNSNLFFLLRGNKNQLFKMGFSDDKIQIEPYLKNSYPAICFEGEYTDTMTLSEKETWIKSFGGFFDRFILDFSSGFPKEWDKHYLFFQIMNFFLVINEYTLIGLSLAILLTYILFLLIFSKYFKQLLLMFVDKWWTLLFFMPLTFVFSLFSTLVIDGILLLKSDMDFWRVIPFPFLVFKIFLIVVCYLMISPAIRHLSFPEDTRFYEKWAMIFLLLDTVIFSLINISFSYYFLWAFLCVAISLFFSDRLVKFLLYAISPLWLGRIVIDFFIATPEYRFCNAMLTNPVIGNAILVLCLTPFILLGSSVLIQLGSTLRKLKSAHLRLGMFVSLGCIALFLLLVFLIPGFSKNRLQVVNLIDTIDMTAGTNQLIITSNSPLGEMSIRDGEDIYAFSTRSLKYSIPKEYIGDLVSMSGNNDSFLARENVLITIVPKGRPYRIQCTIRADEDFELLDSSFPFVKLDDGKSYSLKIGVNPPSPLPVQITIPGSIKLYCDIEVYYISFPFGFSVSGSNKKINTSLAVRNSIEVGK